MPAPAWSPGGSHLSCYSTSSPLGCRRRLVFVQAFAFRQPSDQTQLKVTAPARTFETKSVADWSIQAGWRLARMQRKLRRDVVVVVGRACRSIVYQRPCPRHCKRLQGQVCRQQAPSKVRECWSSMEDGRFLSDNNRRTASSIVLSAFNS